MQRASAPWCGGGALRLLSLLRSRGAPTSDRLAGHRRGRKGRNAGDDDCFGGDDDSSDAPPPRRRGAPPLVADKQPDVAKHPQPVAATASPRRLLARGTITQEEFDADVAGVRHREAATSSPATKKGARAEYTG
eukprot:gene25276-38085_t